MTYLTPDDWYANHGMAPGDARLPQGILQPLPGNNAATPPMRGYFGPRAPTPTLRPGPGATVSPWAVDDSMWGNSPPPPGVSGLGSLGDGVQLAAQPVYIVHRPGHTLRQVGTKVAADLIAAGVLSSLGRLRIPPLASRAMRAQLAGLGCNCGPPRQLGGPLGDGAADAAATIAAMEKKIKAEVMEVAATNTAIGIGLDCIPVVGWAIGLVYSLVTTITEAKYQRAAQKVIADLQTQLQQYAGNLDIKMAALQSQVFDANKQAGITLATSTTPLPPTINTGTCVVTTAPPAAPPVAAGTLPSASASVAASLNTTTTQVPATPAPGAPVNGLGSVFSSINAQVVRATSAVDTAARDAGNAITTVAKAITGQDILNRARAAAATAYAQATAQMLAQYNLAAANVQSAQYGQNLVLVIACRIRQDPSIAQMLVQTTALESAAGSDTGGFTSTAKIAGIPKTSIYTAAAATGAVLLVGILGAR